MADWKEQLRKLAEEEGMELSNASETSDSQPNNPGYEETLYMEHVRGISERRRAKAPYNFVPLNEKVIHGEEFEQFDKYENKRKTGFLDLEIKTLTPLYIRATLKKDAFQKGKQSKHITEHFSPAGLIKIPGSSLRGMVRTLVEIVTWSKLTTDEKKFYFFRSFADLSNLRDEYKEQMNPEGQAGLYNMEAGYLKKEGLRYLIIPAQRDKSQKQYAQIHKRKVEEWANASKKKYPIDNKTYTIFEWDGYWFVISGHIPGKKRHWRINPPDYDSDPIYLNEEDVTNYYNDATRNAVNLIQALEKKDYRNLKLPCFFVRWIDSTGKSRVSFGHTGFFRVAYKQAHKDLLPKAMLDSEGIDMADAIFGRVTPNQIAGRVYFEDALLVSKLDEKPEKKIPQILSSPKPTTFQHYLVQTNENISDMNHYNSETVLRGFKLYWHKSTQWEAQELNFPKARLLKFLEKKRIRLPDQAYIDRQRIKIRNFQSIQDENFKQAIFEFILSDEKSQYTVIEPINKGLTFRSRIRFENLTDIELGALLFVLKLPDTCCHKIGMAKPLGLGSIKITPTLYLSDRKKRYTSLRAEWVDDIQPEPDNKIEKFKQEFQDFIIENLPDTEKPASNDLWDTFRLRQLKALLNSKKLEEKDWPQKVEYQQLGEFRQRKILPIPEEVAQKR